MKRICMKTMSAGPDGVMQPGKEYPVDDKTAKELVDGRYAEYVDAPTFEVATSPEQLEKAEKPKPKGKGRK